MIEQVLINSNQSEKTTYKSDTAKEKPARSVVKSISWRIIGTLDTILISWVITGQLNIGIFNWICRVSNKNGFILFS